MYFQLRMGDFPLPLLAFRSVHVKQWVNAPDIITSCHDKTDMMSLGLISGLVMISLNSSWSSVSEGEQRTGYPTQGFLGSKVMETNIIPYQRILLNPTSPWSCWKSLQRLVFDHFQWKTATANSSNSRVSWAKASSTPSPDSSAAANKFRIFFVCNMRSLSCRWPPNWPLWPLFFVSAAAHHRLKFKNLFYDRPAINM